MQGLQKMCYCLQKLCTCLPNVSEAFTLLRKSVLILYRDRGVYQGRLFPRIFPRASLRALHLRIEEIASLADR